MLKREITFPVGTTPLLSFLVVTCHFYCDSSLEFLWAFNILNLILIFLKQIIKSTPPHLLSSNSSSTLPTPPPPPQLHKLSCFVLITEHALFCQCVRGSSAVTWAARAASLKKTDSPKIPSFPSVKKPHSSSFSSFNNV